MSEPLLPDTTSDEADLGWGEDPALDEDEAEGEDDERLTAERPPHHDRP